MRFWNVGATVGLPSPSEGPADADVFRGFCHPAPPSAIASPAAMPRHRHEAGRGPARPGRSSPVGRVILGRRPIGNRLAGRITGGMLASLITGRIRQEGIDVGLCP